MNEYRYVYFPICLLQEIHINPRKAFNNILDYSIVRYSEQFGYECATSSFDSSKSELIDVYRQIIYAYYHNKLTFGIEKWIDELIEDGLFFVDEDYRGFKDANEFQPEDEIQSLVEAWNDELEKQKLCIRYYRLHLAMNSLGLTGNLGGIWRNSQEVINEVKKHESVHGNDALVSIKTDLLMDFCKNEKENVEYELFTAYCAIKSIMGKKKYASTNKAFIISRMLGAKNSKTLKCLLSINQLTKNQKENVLLLKSVFDKYSKRYHADNLISKLLVRNFLTAKIAEKGTRIIYLSTSLNYTELATELSKKPNAKLKREIIKNEEKKAIFLLNKLRREKIAN